MSTYGNESSAKNYIAPREFANSEARACIAPEIAPFEPITSKCVGILQISCQIQGLSERINARLFDSKVCEQTNGKEPVSVDDILKLITSNLQNAQKVLQEINERI